MDKCNHEIRHIISRSDGPVCLMCENQQLQAENGRLKIAITETLEENGHLADGDVCTLFKLKQALKGGE